VVKRADGMLAFKDLNPQAPTHLLVIPTTHVGTLNDAKDAATLGKLLSFGAPTSPKDSESRPEAIGRREHEPRRWPDCVSSSSARSWGRAMHWPQGDLTP